MVQGCITLHLDLMRKYQITHTEGIVTQCYLIREAAGSSFAIRNLKSELPNITGKVGAWRNPQEMYTTTGCFIAFNQHINNAPASGFATDGLNSGFTIDASLSSNRYGNYTEVNPLYNSCRYIIRY